MKQSSRARRMLRRRRRQQASRLNLVSLMDIFTILVFFLLVNSSDVEVLTNNKSIELPASIAANQPQTNLIIMVNAEQILVGNRAVVQVADIDESLIIPALREELTYRAERSPELTPEQAQKGRPITIMGDKDIPYTLLKQIMSTAAETGYRDVSLAVNQTLPDGAEK